MRKTKEKELNKYIEELKTVKKELIDRKPCFLTIETYKCTLNNGKVIIREKLLKNGKDGHAAIICPITENNTVILTVQPRTETKSTVGVSFPAGYVEENETYEAAALRELQEETGYTTNKLIKISNEYQDQGIAGAFIEGFIALNCKKISDQKLDKDEFIKYFECTIDELFELYDKGYILDGGSKLVIKEVKEYIKERR